MRQCSSTTRRAFVSSTHSYKNAGQYSSMYEESPFGVDLKAWTTTVPSSRSYAFAACSTTPFSTSIQMSPLLLRGTRPMRDPFSGSNSTGNLSAIILAGRMVNGKSSITTKFSVKAQSCTITGVGTSMPLLDLAFHPSPNVSTRTKGLSDEV